MPIDQPVTVLATYDVVSGSLKGGHVRDMKVFAGRIDEKIGVLDEEWRKGLMASISLIAAGVGLLTVTSWWPK